jgi:hypothetical protein
MAGIVGGSAANERLNNNNVKSLTFAFGITGANPPVTMAPVAPTVTGEAKVVLADGAGTIVTAATFDVTVTGANPKAGLEFKDTAITANAELLGASGFVYATNGASNADIGCPVWAGPADLLLATAGVGMALYLNFGQTAIGNSKLDQAGSALGIKFFVTVYYLDR